MHVVNVVLDLLEDGLWHKVSEIGEKSGLHEFKLEILANFLAEYDFMELDEVERKVRLAVSVVDFLKKVKSIEED